MTERPPEDPDADPDGWARFERAVDAALHTPAKHRGTKPKPESKPRAQPRPKTA